MADNGDFAALNDANNRKLFVGGLSGDAGEKELRACFEKFGEIEKVHVKIDFNTGKSRGFAFLLFKDAAAIDQVVNAGEHTINNKTVDAKKAKAKYGKVFIGGITGEMTDDDIKGHFAQFGSVVSVELPVDKIKNERKGFCFITFESEEVARELVKKSKQTIKGKEVDVKKVTPKGDGSRGGPGGGGGGRGRGRSDNYNQGYGGYGGDSFNSGGGGGGGYGGAAGYYGGGGGYEMDNYGSTDYYAFGSYGNGNQQNGGGGKGRGGRGRTRPY